ncbi:MAG: sulfite exporter TauE/SafE family protein [Zavarzinella sp.]
MEIIGFIDAHPLLVYITLGISAFLAGAVNSIAGGGTLLTFPALTAVISGVQANATSTVALFPGSVASAIGYRSELHHCKRLIRLLILPSIIGGIIGSLLVTEFPPDVFDRLVPWLILCAALLFMVQPFFKKFLKTTPNADFSTTRVVLVLLGQLAISIYGGYFGAGIGILMLSILPFMGTGNIHHTNAAKTFLASLINAVTVVIFIAKGKVIWHLALPMVICSIIGGYAGARMARRISPNIVRYIVIGIGISLSAYYMYDRFAK